MSGAGVAAGEPPRCDCGLPARESGFCGDCEGGLPICHHVFDFDAAIRSAEQQMDRENVAHDKRMEFWTGYRTAMEEVKSHWGGRK